MRVYVKIRDIEKVVEIEYTHYVHLLAHGYRVRLIGAVKPS